MKIFRYLIILLSITIISCSSDSLITIDGPCKSVAAYTAIWAIDNNHQYEIAYGILHHSDGESLYHVHTRILLNNEWVWVRLVNKNTIRLSRELWGEFEILDSFDIYMLISNTENYWRN